MQYRIDPPKSYEDVEVLRNDLALMDVKETPVFRLDQMSLTVHGTVQVSGIGEFPLTEIALRDALQRGGLHQSSCENYFRENSPELDQAIVNAANAYYRRSRYAGSEVKLITRAHEQGRLALGIPSARYVLLSHERAVEKILPHSSALELTRCRLYPEFLEISFTDPLKSTRDAVGEIVSVGVAFLNSQGTRTRALVAAAFSLRLVCSNGAVASDKVFSVKYPHTAGILNGNGEFGHKSLQILERFSLMMQSLPKLGGIPVTDKFLSQIRPDITETLGVKESEEFFAGLDRERETVMHLWNRVTHLPHRIESPEKKIKIEQIGFKILTAHLGN